MKRLARNGYWPTTIDATGLVMVVLNLQGRHDDPQAVTEVLGVRLVLPAVAPTLKQWLKATKSSSAIRNGTGCWVDVVVRPTLVGWLVHDILRQTRNQIPLRPWSTHHQAAIAGCTPIISWSMIGSEHSMSYSSPQERLSSWAVMSSETSPTNLKCSLKVWWNSSIKLVLGVLL